MKLLLLLVVLGLAFWLLFGRRRGRGGPVRGDRPDGDDAVPMLACAHCGLHLPRDEALHDAQGRAYCGEAHRDAGPR